MRARAIAFIACALVSWCAASRPAAAADAPQQPAQSPVDTAAQVPDSIAAAVDRFVPANGTSMKANENDMSLGNVSRVSFDAGSGWTLLSALSAERRHYRTQKMTDVMESFIVQASKVAPELYVFNAGIGQSYSKKKTLGLGRYGKDIVFDNQSANAVLSLVSPRLGAQSSNLTFMAEGRRGTNDFKFDRTVGGSVSGALAYAAGDALAASGGFGTMRRVESSEIGGRNFSRMPSTADTIRAGLSYGTGDKKILQVSYLRSNGVERQVMPPLGNSLEILDDPSKATQEEARGRLRELSVGSALAPFAFLSMDIQFLHKLESQTFLVDSRRSGESENTSIEANGYLSIRENGGAPVRGDEKRARERLRPQVALEHDHSRVCASGRPHSGLQRLHHRVFGDGIGKAPAELLQAERREPPRRGHARL